MFHLLRPPVGGGNGGHHHRGGKELGGPAEASILPGASAGQLNASQREPPVSVKSPWRERGRSVRSDSIASALFSLKSRATSAPQQQRCPRLLLLQRLPSLPLPMPAAAAGGRGWLRWIFTGDSAGQFRNAEPSCCARQRRSSCSSSGAPTTISGAGSASRWRNEGVQDGWMFEPMRQSA